MSNPAEHFIINDLRGAFEYVCVYTAANRILPPYLLDNAAFFFFGHRSPVPVPETI